MEVILARPRGFCAGVERAISTVKMALSAFGAPLYVRHEIVHNRRVCDDLRAKGVIFVEELDEVPSGCTVVFSAHGVAQGVVQDARDRGLLAIDAACPLVLKVHAQVRRSRAQGKEVVVVGHKGHPEVEGTLGQADGGVYLVENEKDAWALAVRDAKTLTYVTQTTLSVDDAKVVVEALKKRFPAIEGAQGGDICYATSNRQEAAKALARLCDVVLVLGSRSSSNATRLKEVAEAAGARAYLVERAGQIKASWWKGVRRIGVTAGASTPEESIEEAVSLLVNSGAEKVEELSLEEERVHFDPPPLPLAKEASTS